jgi:hypothetical protein
MSLLAWTYLGYLAVSIGLTVWVGRTLRQSGLELILRHEQQRPVAEALSHLLVIGFYLVNLGAISFLMKSTSQVRDAQTAIELLSTKIGIILVVLGGMHFLLLLTFLTSRKNAERDEDLRARRTAAAELYRLRQAHPEEPTPI